MIKRPPKITRHSFWKSGRAEHSPPSPVYASKCFLPVSYEVKGKGLCYASALSMSHLISYLSNYTVFFLVDNRVRSHFLGFCSRPAFSRFPQSVYNPRNDPQIDPEMIPTPFLFTSTPKWSPINFRNGMIS